MVRDSQLETKKARAKLAVRKKAYAVRVAPGIRLAYRRCKGVGSWSVIAADGHGGDWIERFAYADDQETADGRAIMDYWQARDHAKKLARSDDGEINGDRPVTVRQAIGTDYRADLTARGKQVKNATGLLAKLPDGLAGKPVSMVTNKDVRDFRNRLLAGGIKRCTVTRYMNNFLAALALAAKSDKRIRNASEWKLDPLSDDTKANNVILPDKAVLAIVAAGYEQEDERFGLLVEVLAVCGCRISQAIRLNVEDLLSGDRLDMPSSFKGRGKATYSKRPIPITSCLTEKLRKAAAGRKGDEPLLTDADGKRWYQNCQSSRFPAIAKAAGLDPATITSYALRHSSIVRQLLLNTPIRLVAAHHDTSVAKIEKTYSKFITTPGESMIRRTLLGFDPAGDNVIPMVA